MPDPTLDPAFAALATRCAAVRANIDRLDDAVQLFAEPDDPDRRQLDAWATALRCLVDALEDAVEQMAARR